MLDRLWHTCSQKRGDVVMRIKMNTLSLCIIWERFKKKGETGKKEEGSRCRRNDPHRMTILLWIRKSPSYCSFLLVLSFNFFFNIKNI